MEQWNECTPTLRCDVRTCTEKISNKYIVDVAGLSRYICLMEEILRDPRHKMEIALGSLLYPKAKTMKLQHQQAKEELSRKGSIFTHRCTE